MNMFDTVEFYVITAFVAAAVIAAAAMPARRTAVREFLYGGFLDFDARPSVPGIVATVNDDGSLTIWRFGITGVSDMGAISVAVKVSGFDVTITERLTPGHPSAREATAGCVRLDCLGRERYHFQYINENMGRSAAFTLNMRPGNKIERRLE